MSLTFSQTQGNGSTLSYPIIAKGGYFTEEDIIVELIDVNGDITKQVNETHYNIENGNVIFITAPSSEYFVRIRRAVDNDRTYSDFTRGNSFGADNLNKSLLFALYQTQQLADGFYPEDHYWKEDINAGNKKLTNLADGEDPNDAVTVSQLLSYGGEPSEPGTGVATATASLTNDSALVATYADGSGGTYGTEAVTTTMQIYQGGELQSGWTFSQSEGPGITSTINPITGTCIITNLEDDVDESYVVITARKDGYANRQAVFTIAKAKKGDPGDTLTNYWLTSSVGAINRNNQGEYTPSSIVFNAWKQIGSGQPTPYIGGIRIFQNGSAIPAYFGKASYVDFELSGLVETVECKLYETDEYLTLLDIEGVPVVSDGADGADGADGVDGVDGLGAVDISNWSSELEFVATDYNTVSWLAGSIYTYSNGAPITYNVVEGNTGNMSANTTYYVYLDPGVSTTSLQVTTDPQAPVGLQQILVAVAFPSLDITIDARFQVFGGKGGVFINADSIASSCITGDKIVANTLNAAHINTAGLISYGELSGTKPPINADSTQEQLDLGAAIDAATVYGSTLVSGGYIRTNLIKTDAIVIGDLSGASTFTARDTSYVAGVSASTVKNLAQGSFQSTNAGALAYLSSVDDGHITSISGGKISTGVIYGNNNYSYWDLNNNKMYFSHYAQLKFGTSGAIEGSDGESITFSNGDLQLEGNNAHWLYLQDDRISIYSDDFIDIGCGTPNDPIYIRFGGATYYQFNGYDFKSLQNNTHNCGSANYQWKGVYSYDYWTGTTQFYDTKDDLAIMAEFKPRKKIHIDPETGIKTISEDNEINPDTGAEYMDLLSLPKWMTNYEQLKQKLKEDNGDLLTDEDIEELIEDQHEAGWMLCRNMGEYNDLMSGAVRQLDTESLAMFEMLSSRNTELEKQVTQLSKSLTAMMDQFSSKISELETKIEELKHQ